MAPPRGDEECPPGPSPAPGRPGQLLLPPSNLLAREPCPLSSREGLCKGLVFHEQPPKDGGGAGLAGACPNWGSGTGKGPTHGGLGDLPSALEPNCDQFTAPRAFSAVEE